MTGNEILGAMIIILIMLAGLGMMGYFIKTSLQDQA